MNARSSTLVFQIFAAAMLAAGVLALASGAVAVFGASTYHYTTTGAEIPNFSKRADP